MRADSLPQKGAKGAKGAVLKPKFLTASSFATFALFCG
jgi:hypothetical protein